MIDAQDQYKMFKNINKIKRVWIAFIIYNIFNKKIFDYIMKIFISYLYD